MRRVGLFPAGAQVWKQRTVSLAPDGTKVAYCSTLNVYVQQLGAGVAASQSSEDSAAESGTITMAKHSSAIVSVSWLNNSSTLSCTVDGHFIVFGVATQSIVSEFRVRNIRVAYGVPRIGSSGAAASDGAGSNDVAEQILAVTETGVVNIVNWCHPDRSIARVAKCEPDPICFAHAYRKSVGGDQLLLGYIDGQIQAVDVNAKRVFAVRDPVKLPSGGGGSNLDVTQAIEDLCYSPTSDDFLFLALLANGSVSLYDASALVQAKGKSSVSSSSRAVCLCTYATMENSIEPPVSLAWLADGSGRFVTVRPWNSEHSMTETASARTASRSTSRPSGSGSASGGCLLETWHVSRVSDPERMVGCGGLGDSVFSCTSLSTSSLSNSLGSSSSHGSSMMLLVLRNGQIAHVDSETGSIEFQSLPGHTETIFDACFVPSDANRVATCSYDGFVRLWDVSTGEITTELKASRTMEGQGNDETEPDKQGKKPPKDSDVSGSEQLGSGEKEEVIYGISISGNYYSEAIDSTTPELLAAVSQSGRLFVWDLSSNEQLVCDKVDPEALYRVAWHRENVGSSDPACSSDGQPLRLLAIGCSTGAILYDVNSKKVVEKITSGAEVSGLSWVDLPNTETKSSYFSPSNNTETGLSGVNSGTTACLALAESNGSIEMFQIACLNQNSDQKSTEGNGSVFARTGTIQMGLPAAKSTLGLSLASSVKRSATIALRFASATPAKEASATAAASSSSGSKVSKRACILNGHSSRVFSVAPSRSCPGYMASGGDDRLVLVWNLYEQEVIVRLSGHTGYIRALMWHHEVPGILFSSGWDAKLKVWNLREPLLTKPARTPDSDTSQSDRSPSANSGSDKARGSKSNREDLCMASLGAHTADVYSISSHPMRPFLIATGSRDCTLNLWSSAELVANDQLALCKTFFHSLKTIRTLAGKSGSVDKSILAQSAIEPTVAKIRSSFTSKASSGLGRALASIFSKLESLASESKQTTPDLKASTGPSHADTVVKLHCAGLRKALEFYLWRRGVSSLVDTMERSKSKLAVVASNKEAQFASNQFTDLVIVPTESLAARRTRIESDICAAIDRVKVLPAAMSSQRKAALNRKCSSLSDAALLCGLHRKALELLMSHKLYSQALSLAPLVSVEEWRLVAKTMMQSSQSDAVSSSSDSSSFLSTQALMYISDKDKLLLRLIRQGRLRDAAHICVMLSETENAAQSQDSSAQSNDSKPSLGDAHASQLQEIMLANGFKLFQSGDLAFGAAQFIVAHQEKSAISRMAKVDPAITAFMLTLYD